MDYRDYQHLTFERRPHGVVLITINRPEVLNATNDRLHWELTQIWLTLDADDDARVAISTWWTRTRAIRSASSEPSARRPTSSTT